MAKECILEPGENCVECGRCDCCDLDPDKICDNCLRCLGDADYSGIIIEKIILPKEIKLKYRRRKPAKDKH